VILEEDYLKTPMLEKDLPIVIQGLIRVSIDGIWYTLQGRNHEKKNGKEVKGPWAGMREQFDKAALKDKATQ